MTVATTRDAPAPGTHPQGGAVGPVSLDEIEDAQQSLMRAYLAVIGAVAGPDPPADHRSALTASQHRFAVRALAELHIRRRLTGLAATYAQFAAASTSQCAPARWFEGARSDCAQFADTLPKWPIATALAAVPLAAGAISALAEGASVGDPRWLVAGLLLLLVAYWAIGLRDAFAEKRALFTRSSASGHSIYALEDAVFAHVGRRKPLEPAADVIAEAGGLAICVGGIALLVSDIVVVGPVLFTLVTLVLAAAVVAVRARGIARRER